MTYPVMKVGVKEAGDRFGLRTAVHPWEAWGVSLEAGSLRREDRLVWGEDMGCPPSHMFECQVGVPGVKGMDEAPRA